jgi:hypothetical protein
VGAPEGDPTTLKRGLSAIPRPARHILISIAIVSLHRKAAGSPIVEGFLDLVDGPPDSNHHERLTTGQPALKEADRHAGMTCGELKCLRPPTPR